MLLPILSVLILLIIASTTHQLAKQWKIPHTILLFVIGVLIALLNQGIWYELIPTLQLTPDLLFFVFLPVLIFESGYSIKYYKLSKNYLTIRTMAIGGVIISSLIIGVVWRRLLNILWFNIPFLLTLLFGVIISSTDPVAVLAIFKDMGIPKRLRLLFEGESLFNDGTSLALFLVLLELITKNTFTTGTFLQGLGSFAIMVVGGMILWILVGVCFSSLIQRIKNNEPVEITLTMVLAHLTFILAEFISHHAHIGEFNIQISWVIATAYAALILGNYGKTKITPKVEEYMEKFRRFFAFVCNSLVFLLMGFMVQKISVPVETLIPVVAIAIGCVILARAISVYLPIWLLNVLGLHERVPMSRQHLLARWGLRWALALVLVLLIPDGFTLAGREHSYDPKSFILMLTIATVIFSLIVEWLTMKPMIKKMNMNKLYDLEEFEQYESEIIVYDKIIQKIEQMQNEYHISRESYDILLEKYRSKIQQSRLKMQVFLQGQETPDLLIQKAITLHALGIERQYLKEMFMYNEMSENLYHYMGSKIDTQISRVKSGDEQIRWFDKPEYMKTRFRDPIIRLMHILQHTKRCTHDSYIINRTRVIVTNKVLEWLTMFHKIDFGYTSDALSNVQDLYRQFNQRANQEIADLKIHDDKEVDLIDGILLNKWLAKTEEHIIHDLLNKYIITEKLYDKFMEEIEDEILRTY